MIWLNLSARQSLAELVRYWLLSDFILFLFYVHLKKKMKADTI
jgi:hypothetical protein